MKECEAMKEVHRWREELAEEWKTMDEKEIINSINEAGKELREKIEKKRKEVA
jgi:predicted metal-dependent phosphoesterase TrpH